MNSRRASALKLSVQPVIQEGDFIAVQKVGSQQVRIVKATKKQKVTIDRLRFDARSAIGAPYGLFEVFNQQLSALSADAATSAIEEINLEQKSSTDSNDAQPASTAGASDINEEVEAVENDPTATGSPQAELKDAQQLQKLTANDIHEMKADGVTTAQIVARLRDGNKHFANRTTFAKSKYIAKKAKKHSDRVFIMRPTFRLVYSSLRSDRDIEKIANIRLDQIGLLMQTGGVMHGRQVLVFEQTNGLVTASTITRLGGGGRCYSVQRTGASIQAVHSMAFDSRHYETLYPLQLQTILKKGDNIVAELATTAAAAPQVQPNSNGDGPGVSDAPMESGNDEKSTATNGGGGGGTVVRSGRLRRELDAYNELVERGGADSLLVALRDIDPVSTLETLWPLLASAAPVVIYVNTVKYALEAAAWLKESAPGGTIDVRVQDALHRELQVLPDRTHPLMSQQVTGGLVISAIKLEPYAPPNLGAHAHLLLEQ